MGVGGPAEAGPGPPDLEYASVAAPPRSRDEDFTAAFGPAERAALARTAWLLTGDSHRAEELVQLALVRTYVAWPRAAATEPLAYARRVMANARIDAWRRSRRESLRPPEGMPEDASRSATGTVDDRDQLVRALRELSPRLRRVIVLRYMVGLSERETAEDLGISIGTVKSQSSRGLARLRESVNERPTVGSGGGTPCSHDQDAWAEELRRRGAELAVPPVRVDIAQAISQGRRVRRRRAATGSAVGAIAIAGLGYAATTYDGPRDATGTGVDAAASATAHATVAEPAPLDLTPGDEALTTAAAQLAPVLAEFPDVVGEVRWLPDEGVLTIGVTAGAARADAFASTVAAMDIAVPVRLVDSSPYPKAALMSAAARLSADTGNWADGLTVYTVSTDAERGVLVITVDPEQLAAWVAHLASVDLGVPAIAQPGSPPVLQPGGPASG